MRLAMFIFCVLPVFGFAQQKSKMDLDSLLKKQAGLGFSGVLLVAENGKPLYHHAVGLREYVLPPYH